MSRLRYGGHRHLLHSSENPSVLQSYEQAKTHLHSLSQLVQFADVQSADISNALLAVPDFEDAVVDAIAACVEAEQILTRNTKDFIGSAVPAVTPAEFLLNAGEEI